MILQSMLNNNTLYLFIIGLLWVEFNISPLNKYNYPNGEWLPNPSVAPNNFHISLASQ